MSLRRILLAGLCLALAPTALRAEEPAAPTPAERTAAVLAGLDAKAAGKGFRFDGVLINNGSDLGPVRLSIEPAPAGSGAAWLAVEELRVGPEQGGVHILQEARLGARLEALEGRTTSVMPGEPTVVLSWKRDGEGYAFERRLRSEAGEATGEPVSFRVASPAPRSATMAATVFFLLHAPAAPADYALETLVLDANMGEDPQVRARHLTLRVGPLEQIEVAGAARTLPLVRVERAGAPDESSVLALSEDRRGLVQFEQPARGLLMRAAKSAKQPFDFKAPARTAEAAALQAARAFAIADVEALDGLLNWENVQATLAKDGDLKDLAPEARRAAVLAQLRATLQPAPTPLIEGVLRGAEGLLEVESLGEDRARVAFPPVFRNLKLVVRKVGEVWKLDELPGSP